MLRTISGVSLVMLEFISEPAGSESLTEAKVIVQARLLFLKIGVDSGSLRFARRYMTRRLPRRAFGFVVGIGIAVSIGAAAYLVGGPPVMIVAGLSVALLSVGALLL